MLTPANFSTANGSWTGEQEHVETSKEAQISKTWLNYFITVYVKNDIVHGIHDAYVFNLQYHPRLEFVPQICQKWLFTVFVNSVVHMNYANELSVPGPFHE